MSVEAKQKASYMFASLYIDFKYLISTLGNQSLGKSIVSFKDKELKGADSKRHNKIVKKKLKAIKKAKTYDARIAAEESLESYLTKNNLQLESTKMINKALDEMRIYSPQLYNRLTGSYIDSELGSFAAEQEFNNLYNIKNRNVADFFMRTIKEADTWTISAIWSSAMDKAKAEHTTIEDMDEYNNMLQAKGIHDENSTEGKRLYNDMLVMEQKMYGATLAEKAVRRTQPTYSNKDRTPFQRSMMGEQNLFAQFLNLFTSVTTKISQMYQTNNIKSRYKLRDSKNVAQKSMTVAGWIGMQVYLTILMSLPMYVIEEIFSLLFGYGEDDKFSKESFGKRLVGYIAALSPSMRMGSAIWDPMLNLLGHKELTIKGNKTSEMITNKLSSITKATDELYKYYNDAATYRQLKPDDIRKDIVNILDGGSALGLGIPVKQIDKFTKLLPTPFGEQVNYMNKLDEELTNQFIAESRDANYNFERAIPRTPKLDMVSDELTVKDFKKIPTEIRLDDDDFKAYRTKVLDVANSIYDTDFKYNLYIDVYDKLGLQMPTDSDNFDVAIRNDMVKDNDLARGVFSEILKQAKESDDVKVLLGVLYSSDKYKSNADERRKKRGRILAVDEGKNKILKDDALDYLPKSKYDAYIKRGYLNENDLRTIKAKKNRSK